MTDVLHRVKMLKSPTLKNILYKPFLSTFEVEALMFQKNKFNESNPNLTCRQEEQFIPMAE